MGKCAMAGKKCAGKNGRAKKCIDAMMQMKGMQDKPSSGVMKCMKMAGVNPKNVESTGDVCKLAGCIVPQLKAPEAQCYMSCHVNSQCGCKVKAKGKCAPLGMEELEYESEDYVSKYGFDSFFNA